MVDNHGKTAMVNDLRCLSCLGISCIHERQGFPLKQPLMYLGWQLGEHLNQVTNCLGKSKVSRSRRDSEISNALSNWPLMVPNIGGWASLTDPQ